MGASKFTASNLVPRPNLERLADTLPKPTMDVLWKARGCHLNALEGFPLFAAAMVSCVRNVFFWVQWAVSKWIAKWLISLRCLAGRDIRQNRHQGAQFLCWRVSCRSTPVQCPIYDGAEREDELLAFCRVFLERGYPILRVVESGMEGGRGREG